MSAALNAPAPPRPNALPPGATCQACGYSLDGLAVGVCPECGERYVEPLPPSLSDRTAGGFAMMTVQTIIARFASMAGNLVLAKLLAPEYFGLLAMATTVTSFASLVQQIGVREVLIHRQTSFRRWASSAFWLTVVTGVVCGLLMAALAPVAARIYQEPTLVGMLLILAVSTTLANVTIVHETKLQMDLRFKAVAWLTFGTAIGTVGLSILLAWLGFGAYSFVLPRLAVNVGRCAVLFRISGFTPRMRPQANRWRFMAGDSAWILAYNVCNAIILAGDTAIVGKLLGADGAGVYFFAISLSLQANVLLVNNLGSILLPALGKLGAEPRRQADALLRSLRVLGMVLTPLCLLQAAVAGPVLHLLYRDKWDAAVAPMQLLCLGMAARFLSQPAANLLLAQGRFRGLFLTGVGGVVLFLSLICGSVLAFGPSVIAVAGATAVYSIIIEPSVLLFTIRPMGRGVRSVLGVVAPPAAISGVACGAALLVARALPSSAMPSGRWGDVVQGTIIAMIALPVIALGSWLFLRSSWNEAWLRATPIVNRLSRMIGLPAIRAGAARGGAR